MAAGRQAGADHDNAALDRDWVLLDLGRVSALTRCPAIPLQRDSPPPLGNSCPNHKMYPPLPSPHPSARLSHRGEGGRGTCCLHIVVLTTLCTARHGSWCRFSERASYSDGLTSRPLIQCRFYGSEPVLSTGPPLYVLITCLAMPLLYSLPTALLSAELATNYPETGGQCVYLTLTLTITRADHSYRSHPFHGWGSG
jgi:hypothetical protein